MENVRKHRQIKHLTNEANQARKNQLVLEPNYHKTNVLAKGMKKTQIHMNKPVYLGLSILELSKIVLYEFCMIVLKQNIEQKPKLYYMDAGSFIVYIKANHICKDIVNDVEQGLILEIRIRQYHYLKEKQKRKLKFEDYKNCIEATELENKINYLEKDKIETDSLKKDHKEFIKNNKLILKTHQRFMIEKNNLFSEEINKIALNSNDGKTMQPLDSIERYVYGKRKDLVSEIEEIKCDNIY